MNWIQEEENEEKEKEAGKDLDDTLIQEEEDEEKEKEAGKDLDDTLIDKDAGEDISDPTLRLLLGLDPFEDDTLQDTLRTTP